jgi:hypothetical protein
MLAVVSDVLHMNEAPPFVVSIAVRVTESPWQNPRGPLV